MNDRQVEPDDDALDRLRLAAIVESSDDAIVGKDLDGTIRTWNPAAERIFGYTADEILGRSIYTLIPEELHAEEHEILDRIRAGARGAHYETTRVRKDGRRITIALTLSAMKNSAGTVIGASSIKRDITAQRALEAQFRQAQKMEPVGRLAGGVAHDFNNLLTIVMGSADLIIKSVPKDGEAYSAAREILTAAEQAAKLTRQLLAFGRRQVQEREPLSLNRVIADSERILRRMVGEDVELRTVLAPTLSPVIGDLGQMEQVILNLVVNARDAMPDGGKLTIATQDIAISEILAAERLTLEPGQYVMLSVSDTGIGMDALTQASIFEPFFTTKEPGRGTGLGLSTVYGIVQQSGGGIHVYSEVGHGTTFKIYLPKAEDSAVAHASPPPEEAAAQARGTVLLVEDEPAVRRSVAKALESAGFVILMATDGTEAVSMAERVAGRIDLLLTDVVMPGLNGREVVSRIADMHPEARVLFMSGYADDHVVRTGALLQGAAFIAKPFTPQVLVARVREMIAPHEPVPHAR